MRGKRGSRAGIEVVLSRTWHLARLHLSRDIAGLIATAAATSPKAKQLTPAADVELAESRLFQLESAVCEAHDLLVAIRSMATSDDMPSEEGNALAVVSQQAIDRLNHIKAEREWSWRLLRRDPTVPEGFERIEHDGKVWLKVID